MISQIQIIIGSICLMAIISLGWWVKSLNDANVKCKTTTKIKEAEYKRNLKSYEDAIDDIAKFYNIKLQEVSDFKKGDNETDCEASYRFLNTISY